MQVLLIVVSILLIAIVLLQSGKAESASMLGGNSDLFSNRKERGVEVFITRTTLVLGIVFFMVCLVLGF